MQWFFLVFFSFLSCSIAFADINNIETVNNGSITIEEMFEKKQSVLSKVSQFSVIMVKKKPYPDGWHDEFEPFIAKVDIDYMLVISSNDAIKERRLLSLQVIPLMPAKDLNFNKPRYTTELKINDMTYYAIMDRMYSVPKFAVISAVDDIRDVNKKSVMEFLRYNFFLF